MVCLRADLSCTNTFAGYRVEVFARYAVGNRDSVYTNTVADRGVPLLICLRADLIITHALAVYRVKVLFDSAISFNGSVCTSTFAAGAILDLVCLFAALRANALTDITVPILICWTRLWWRCLTFAVANTNVELKRSYA